MTEPFSTVLREIADAPDTFSPYVVASWCGKAADRIEELEAELDQYRKGYKGACYACEPVGEQNQRLRDALEEIADHPCGEADDSSNMKCLALEALAEKDDDC